MTRLKVGVLGASGYGGAELLRRLVTHPFVTVSGLASRQFAGQAVAACWPQLAGAALPAFEDAEAVIAGCDVLFCATPHGETAPFVQRALAAGKRVVDLSADFRLAPKDYAAWYGPHPYPEGCARAVYGLTELHREELRGAELVAVPGCNCTAGNLALAPLALHGLLGEHVTVNVLTGVSGAGRSAALGFHFPELNENARPYKAGGTHRHTAELEDTLGRVAAFGRQVKTRGDFARPTVSFTPHLVPMTRGILATCTVRPDPEHPEAAGLSTAALLERYEDFYRGEPLVTVQEDLPQTKAVSGSDRTLVSVRYDKRSGTVTAFAALDNLGKGAAGGAVQAFNAAHGFGETLGLFTQGVWP
ncbi:N-acetyl-gamma-glutamyl-phosphate reductase [Truepera radiovictrix]|uniref:N-acetyl-gamma-glutamyl-phosphate reductase n=1 Tax=Truepera radiovictrix (strain DSM 17093 / CIP 108686 / LMG 22925 / RQ-24) TaxID=649638 RepID=D7CX82_TRURR|nr:N-acetyl-gamma-glutamyl-phosphate reductase [Truepera radiovictrix]ADI13206.1 N-acetyl-gamma-glutamyl-phosphate reductase [Truepera radiovictrix DSM 17093]WMT58226.1 N-acetyl-gamma-glutamyl-phosphate reductase [Truepera radiovictrix]